MTNRTTLGESVEWFDDGTPCITDGFGSYWDLCLLRLNCGLVVVRPGKVQCDHENCPEDS